MKSLPFDTFEYLRNMMMFKAFDKLFMKDDDIRRGTQTIV